MTNLLFHDYLNVQFIPIAYLHFQLLKWAIKKGCNLKTRYLEAV